MEERDQSGETIAISKWKKVVEVEWQPWSCKKEVEFSTSLEMKEIEYV